MEMPTLKFCPKHNNGAGKVLPASEFRVITIDGKKALSGYCKACGAQVHKDYYAQHKDKLIAASTAWRKAHPEVKRHQYKSQKEWRERDRLYNPDKYSLAYWSSHLSKYGITAEQYKEKLAEQGGHCALCPKKISSHNRRLGVDHNHETGKVRGILCDRCNNCLERIESNHGWEERAKTYLARYQ